MKLSCFVLLLLLLAVGLAAGCNNRNDKQESPEIAVTNSYLQAAVKDLCPQQREVLCLTAPGMCPGHFDISPATAQQLRHCRLLLRFDFQEGLDESLARMTQKGLIIEPIAVQAGLSVPATYLAVCEKVCHTLAQQYPHRKEQYQQRLSSIRARLDEAGGEVRDTVKQAGLAGTKVIAANHQAAFARWLGLEVVATFKGGDTATIAQIDQCLRKAADNNVTFVIANKQQGTELAKALAEQLGVPVVIFGNFPDARTGGHAFDRLLQRNFAALLEQTSAWHKSI